MENKIIWIDKDTKLEGTEIFDETVLMNGISYAKDIGATEGQMPFGNIISASVSFTIWAYPGFDMARYEDRAFVYYYRSEDTTYWRPAGIFIVDSVSLSTNTNTASFVAYDIMNKTKDCRCVYQEPDTFYNIFSAQLTEFYNYALGYYALFDMTQALDSLNPRFKDKMLSIDTENITAQTVFQTLAKLGMGFLHCTTFGHIEISEVGKVVNIQYMPKDYRIFDWKGYSALPVDRITYYCDDDNSTYTTGTGDNEYVIQDSAYFFAGDAKDIDSYIESVLEIVNDNENYCWTYNAGSVEFLDVPYLYYAYFADLIGKVITINDIKLLASNISWTKSGATMESTTARKLEKVNNPYVDTPTISASRVKGMPDYVSDFGEKDGWTYRKWNSGYIEIFGRKQVSLPAYSSVGGHYRSVATLTIPFSMPTASRLIQNGTATVSGSYAMVNSDYSGDDTKIEVISYRESALTTSSSVEMSIHIAGYPN